MISLRLENIIKLIEKDSCVADIGSDHGYLLIELKKRQIAKKLFGVENKKGPFEHLMTNVQQIDPDFRTINISFSSGLEKVPSIYSTVVIAGMGFPTIRDIIKNNLEKTDNIDTFIIDAHTCTPQLREFMSKIGYYIDEELCFFENKIFYEVIRFKKGHEDYDELQIKYGPKLIEEKNSDFIEYYTQKINKIDDILTNRNVSDDSRNKLLSEKKEIEQIL